MVYSKQILKWKKKQSQNKSKYKIKIIYYVVQQLQNENVLQNVLKSV